MAQPKLQITKIDAARRQVETAIHLWLDSSDPVSVHTLAAAAHQVLHDLGTKQGHPSILRGLIVVRPEYRKKVAKALVKAENFLKHADKDPQQVLDFNPEATEILLLDAVITYEIFTGKVVPLLSTFKLWMFLNRPEFMEKEVMDKVLKQNPSIAADTTLFSKQEFFKLWLDVLRDLEVNKPPA